MTIRRATAADIPQIDELLRQVLEVHHAGRPDLFKGGVKKYTDEELKAILANDQTPVFVAVAPSANDGNDAEHNADSPATDQVLGYAFCVFQQHLNSNILTDIKTLYIDDLCVDERSRGHHVGSTLYRYVLDFARQFRLPQRNCSTSGPATPKPKPSTNAWDSLHITSAWSRCCSAAVSAAR